MQLSLGLSLGSARVSAPGGAAVTVQITGLVNNPQHGLAAQTGVALGNDSAMPGGATLNWQRNGVDIPGATGASFTPVIGGGVSDGDTIRLRVEDGGTSYFSAGYSVRYAVPVVTVQPAWSTSAADLGDSVTLTPGTGSAGAVRSIDYLTLGGADDLAGLSGTSYSADALGTVAYREVWTSSGGTVYSNVIGFEVEPVPPVAGSLTAINEAVGSGSIMVDLSAGFTSTRPLTYTKSVAWGGISGSNLTIGLDIARNESITITATDDYGQSAQVALQVTIAEASSFAFTQLETYQVSVPTGTTHTKTGYALGAADPAREIVLALGGYWRGASGVQPQTVTITPDGGSAIALTRMAAASGDHLSVWTATVPTGTTGTITVTHEASVGTYIVVTGLRVLGHTYAIATHAEQSASSGTMTLDQNVEAGDELVAVLMHSSSSGVALTASGLTEVLTSNHTTYPHRRQAVYAASVTADETPRAMSFSGEATGNATMYAITLALRSAGGAVVQTPAGEIDVEIGTPFTIPAGYYGAGTYTVNTAEMADGIEFIVPGEITGDVILGATLSQSNGAIYVYTGAAPTATYNWQADGVDIPGATNPAALDTTSHAGKVIRLRTTAGGVDSFSNTITVNSVNTLEFTELASKQISIANGNDIVITDYDLGFPHADREILIVLGGYWRSAAGAQPLSVTLTPEGGSAIAMTRMTATNGGNELAAYTATVPSGTTGTLTIAHGATNGPYILLTGARLRGHQYAVAQHSSIAAGSGLMTLDQNVLAGDEVLTLMMHSSSSVALAASGLDVALFSTHEDHPIRRQAVGRASITADQSPRAMSFTGETNGNAAMKAITIIIRGA